MQNNNLNHSLIEYFRITFVYSWVFWGIAVAGSLTNTPLVLPNMGLVVLGSFGPLVASLYLTYRDDGGWAGVKQFLLSGLRLRMSWVLWLLALVLPFAFGWLAVWINWLLTGFQYDQTLLSQPIQILPTFLIMFIFGGSVEEEFGWRGYALPRLLQKWSPLTASLVLGVIWGVWHWPLFLITGTSQVFMPLGVHFLLVIAFSVLITGIYLRSGKNLFSALLLHTAINTSLNVFPPVELKAGGNQMALTYLMLIYGLAAVILVLADRKFWFKPAAAGKSAAAEQ